MWKVWRVLLNTPCSPLLSPRHGAAYCYVAAGATANCTILVKSRVCSSPKQRWTTLVTSVYGGQRNGLFIRSCRDSASCRIRPFSKFRVNLCAAPSCNTVLYKTFPSANASIHQAGEYCDWFQLTQILPFFVLYRRPILCNAPFIVHLPWREQLAVKYISQASHVNRAFSLTDLR